MPYQKMPSFNETKLNMLEIPKPGIGGLNLFDLEYEQETNQSPYMLNMMYRNGTFAKRYGQDVYGTYDNEVYAVEYFNGDLIVHTGTQMLIDGDAYVGMSFPATTGIFIKFYKTLLYYCNGTIYEYKHHPEASPPSWQWGIMEPHIPEFYTGCKPDGTGTPKRGEDLNLLTKKYTFVYNGDGTANYVPVGERTDIVDWSADPDTKHSKIIVKVEENEVLVTKTEGASEDYTIDETNKKVVFNSGKEPTTGTDNVEITFTYNDETLKNNRARLMDSKFYSCYGANGNSHLFLAGGGDGFVFYSDSYDHTYFPENNWMVLGSSEEDITGFGLQYNVLIVFKPKEIYSLYSYNVTASMVKTDEEDSIGVEKFGAQIVNSQVGCDAPYSIQLINNQLTWFNSKEGVCTLVSTNIADERNVRFISRNIDHTNNMGEMGILDIDLNENYVPLYNKIVSVDYDYKYFICFPKRYVWDGNDYVVEDYGRCYVWDYSISPFTFTASKATDPKTLDWFAFDNQHVKKYLSIGQDLIYISNKTGKEQSVDKYLLVRLDNSFGDIDLNDIDEKIGINSYYMTPFLQLGAVSYLKTIKNLYIQCRGDTASRIDVFYYTDESGAPTQDSNSIIIGGRIWNRFEWNTFTWSIVNWASTFRRKCSLKKVQMASFLFKNNEVYRDMSITHISLQYQIDRLIK